MKKKTAAMVLAALMAFSMTACGNGSTQKEDDSTATDQETTETADNAATEDTTSGDETVELHWLNKCESDVEAQICYLLPNLSFHITFTGLISVKVMWKLRYGSR